MNDILNSLVEIELKEDDDFLKIKETLTRIGISSKRENILYQTCHIFHKQGKYYIVHFKEMFMVDGKDSDFSEDDLGRRNKIINLLQDWGLLTVMRSEMILNPVAPMNQIKIINHKEKKNWSLQSKYNIGAKR